MNEILKIENLIVEYSGVKVLNINEMSVATGEVVGIIGKNGAGKSTLINCILDEIQYKGNIIRQFNEDEIGVQFQVNSYNELMKVSELIQIVAKQRIFDSNLKSLIKDFELTDMLKKRIGVLSGGERQRLTLFLVLFLKPNVLFFDELTTGLDYEKRKKMLKTVKDYSKGKTVFIVSHYFDEIQNWANKLLVLDKGNPIFFGKLEQLQGKYPHYGIIKIDEKFESKEFEIISEENTNSSILVVKDKEEQIKAMEMLNAKKVTFEFGPCSIYSLYTILLNEYNMGNLGKEEKDA